ncbi:MAG TPA: galactokinase, partial [Chitinophagaceae bacterium]|nr:galactokinase [Chitinophagaceae bacterium]
FALNKIFQLNISLKDLALISKKVENEFIGVNCGIMDQFAVAMGKKDKAILLNCETLEHEYIPFQTGNYSLAIINSNKQRTLLGSKYNERFTECGAALRALKKKIPIQNLCDLDMKTFETYRYLIEHPVLQKRALHVISENERVGYAVNALKKNDLLQFGQLMFVSHQSLKEDYEVSGRELDTIIEFCKTYSGCIGARMTGAGFGGCAIALIQNERFADFSEKLISYYKELIGYAPAPFVTEVGDGVKQVTL